MPRYPIQIINLILYFTAALLGIYVVRKSMFSRMCNLFIFGWVVHSFIFMLFAVARIIFCCGEPSIEFYMVFWANIVQGHGALAAMSTFWATIRTLKGLNSE